jgi:hypothetical protein
MTSAVSQRWSTGTDIRPVIVVLCNMEVASVFRGVVVRVADERSFPVVMEVSIGDCDPFRSMGDVHQTIIVVFIMIKVGIKLAGSD